MWVASGATGAPPQVVLRTASTAYSILVTIISYYAQHLTFVKDCAPPQVVLREANLGGGIW